LSDVSFFKCPVCSSQLHKDGKSLKCQKGHSFDIAKQGYVNLLMSNKSANHGDDKLMVKARQTFLEKGYYSKLKESVADIVGKGHVLLDAGCGEGYYTDALSLNNSVCGIDISKEALKIAAKRCKNAEFAVASIYDIPLADSSVDTVVNIFAPDSPEEYLRILQNKGRLIMVTPMKNHLIELKNAVYDDPYTNPYVDPAKDGFKILSSTELKYSIDIECNEDIVSLFKMTPYYYKTSEKDQNKLNFIDHLKTSVEFLITEYQKI